MNRTGGYLTTESTFYGDGIVIPPLYILHCSSARNTNTFLPSARFIPMDQPADSRFDAQMSLKAHTGISDTLNVLGALHRRSIVLVVISPHVCH